MVTADDMCGTCQPSVPLCVLCVEPPHPCGRHHNRILRKCFVKHPCRLVQVRCAVCTMFSIFSLMFTGLLALLRTVAYLSGVFTLLGRPCEDALGDMSTDMCTSSGRVGLAVRSSPARCFTGFFPSVTQAQGCGGIRCDHRCAWTVFT